MLTCSRVSFVKKIGIQTSRSLMITRVPTAKLKMSGTTARKHGKLKGWQPNEPFNKKIFGCLEF